MLGIKKIELKGGFFWIVAKDLIGYRNKIYRNEDHLRAAVQWIKRAQNACTDGGVSAGYYGGIGWRPSYPEITGYIIPSLFDYFHFANDHDCAKRAKEMSDFLVKVQMHDGAFQSGVIGDPLKSEVFNTGQCLQGLVRSYKETNNEEYLESAIKAGNWLLSVQDDDGSWNHKSYKNEPHTYYARVAWPLLELYEVTKDEKYRKAGKKHAQWVCTNINEVGWYHNCGFGDSTGGSSMQNPLTHTIAYTAEGLLECGIALQDQVLINASTKTMNNILKIFERDGIIKATYNERWQSHDKYSCLTGNAQISLTWLKLFKLSGEEAYKNAAKKLNNLIKTTQIVDLRNSLAGCIKGSQPIYGRYNRFGYPTWATKFFIDSLLMEEKIRG